MRRFRYAIAHQLMRLSIAAAVMSLRVVGLDKGLYDEQFQRFKAWETAHQPNEAQR